MYPTNQCMDPYYSYCRDHPPYPYYPPPGWEAGHHQMAMDSSCRPPSYGPLPYSGSTSHSHLPESHSCCNKTYPPGYYSHRPPFPPEFPPQHLYSHGLFPYHLNTYPSYFVPPPPYPVDQIPYGYGKFKGHCCGCPNHLCHGGEKSNLKIEEEMPEVKPDSEKKGADNSSIIGHPSYQYPAMWLPSGNMKDNIKGRDFGMSPQLLSKWFPDTGEWTGDVKQQRHDNHNARQFQWPIVRMPVAHDEPKQENKELEEVCQSPKVTKEAPHSPDVKIIPLSWFENDCTDQKPARDGSGEHNRRSSATNQSAGVNRKFKTIPVVPGEIKSENKSAEKNCKAISDLPDKEGDEKKVHTCRTIPVILPEKDDEKATNAEKEGENRESKNVETSKPKLSKLPPVCLRVDPLPRKKSGNRSSGSLNPATKKVCEKGYGMKEAQSKNQEKELSEPNKENQNKEYNEPVKEKSSEMGKRIGSRNVTVRDASVKPAQEEEFSTTDEKVQPSISAEAPENASAGSLQDCDKSTGGDNIKFHSEASKSAREINLSEPEAAVCIQSAYRGYDVRRWQPLEKLRKVKNIRDQMQDLKKKLQGLETSSNQPTAKEQVAINETIMNLLLNLDTIQGLHPSVREARKSVARELVCLQEKLDSLCKQLPSEPNQFTCEKEKPKRTIQTTAHVSTAEASQEEKAAAKGEGHEVSSSDCVQSLHDEQSLSEESSALEQCPDSTEQNSYTEDLNTGVCSRSATEDSTAAMASLPMQKGESVDKDGAAECQVWQSAALKSSALKPDAAAVTEDDQYKETSVQRGQPCAYLKDAELHEHEPHIDFTSFSLGDEPEEASGANMQNHGADTIMQDSSAKEPDGTPEPRVGDTDRMDYASTAIAENSAKSPLPEETPQPDSTLLQESEAVEPCEFSCKADPALVEQSKEDRLEIPAGDFSIGEKREAVSRENEAKSMEDTLHDARVPSTMRAEPGLPESVSNEPLSDEDGAMLHENPDTKMSLESHSHAQDEYVSEDKTSEGSEAAEAVECNEMLREASVCATGPHCAELPADDLKEDAGIQMAPEEAATVPATHCAMKNHEKNLADENLKLKEMLQTLLSTGNEQMGLITELSEKVKTLERRLAHKRRPKVRVYRPARNATPNVH